MAEKILVIDDDLDTLRLVGLMLERQGYEIAAASNGLQGLSMAKSEKPDLLLLDIMMPDISGVHVAQKIRSDPELEDVMIIMFTAKTQLDDKLEGFDAGADDYVTKPIQPRELIAHVKAVMKRSRTADVPSTLTRSKRGHVIGVLAAKGGLGVSTIALNLGLAMNQYEKEIIIADFRPGCGTIGMQMAFEKLDGLNHLIERKASSINPATIDPELVTHSSGLRFLLSSSHPRDAAYSNAVESFEAIVLGMAYLAPIVILDLGVSLTPVNTKMLQYCDQIVVVMEPVEDTIMQTELLVDKIVTEGVTEDRISVVLVNRLRLGIQLSFGQVKQIFGREIAGIFTAIPDLAYQATVKNTPIIRLQPDGVSAQQFHNLSTKVLEKVS
jgi:pilus assembly protein CpaE